MKDKILTFLTVFIVLCSITGCEEELSADRIVYGNIWTADPENPWANGMAIKADTILAVGKVSEMEAYKGNETIVTALHEDNLLIPGFMDSHTHYIDGGLNLSAVQLRSARTSEDFIQRIAYDLANARPG